MTTKSNIAEDFSSGEYVTKVHEEEQNNGKVKFEINYMNNGIKKLQSIKKCVWSASNMMWLHLKTPYLKAKAFAVKQTLSILFAYSEFSGVVTLSKFS